MRPALVRRSHLRKEEGRILGSVRVLKTSIMLSFCAVITGALMIECAGVKALAQQPTAPAKPPRKPLKNTENPEFKGERVAKPMDLPDMPAYTGKNTKFVTGTIFRQVKGGASLTEQFTVKEPPDQVLQWYKDTFAANKWTPQTNMTGKSGLAAMKGNNICQVMTMSPTSPASKCDVMIRYKFYEPTKFP